MSLARELGADVKEMELVLRTAYELPLHDVEREKDLVRARLHGIEARMAAAGKAGEGPGHYALGRGHLALQEPEAALSHLERASLAGYASPELDYALGIALGELYAKALVAATRIGNPAQRAAREQAIKEQYEVPALQHLRASLGARLETAAYAEGLLLLHEGKAEEAVAKAEEAFEQVPWLYEAKKLEGDARFAIGSRFRHDAAFEHDKMMGHFQAAAADYQRAAEIGRSDPRVHVAECELWAQVMNAASLRKDPLKPGFDRAKAACVRAITASPKSADARIKLGFVHVVFAWGLATGDPPLDPAQVLEEAIALGKEAMRWSPQEPMAPYVMGDAWRTEAFYRDDRGIDSSASIDQAVVSFEAAVRLDPTFVWPVQGLGNVYSMKARDDAYHGRDPVPSFEKALEYCRRGSELDPSHSPSRNAEIVTHLMLAEYLAAVGRDPGSSLSLARKGVAVLAELSPEWPWGDYFLAYAHWIEATHALDAGRDPTASLDLGAKVVAELARRSPASQDVHEMLGRLAVTRALHLLRRGKDPGPALGAARESFRKVAEGKPWDLGFQVWRARVESIGLRWASKAHELRAEPIRTARELLLPLLAEERVDPRLYQTMAEIDAIEAAWFQERGRSAEQAVAGGLAMADKALALNPHMAQALLARGALFLVRARAARAPQVRREAARSAEEALAAALRENPLLDGDVAPLLVEAKRARQSDGISEK